MHEYVRPPSEISETTTVLGAAPCDHRLDAAFAKFLAMWFGVVAAIGVDDLRFLKRPAAYVANRHNGIAEWQQSADVVAIRSGQDRPDGDAIRVGEEVMSGIGSRAFRGVRASIFCTPKRISSTMNRRLIVKNRAGRPRVTQ
jgi:hypothetical protein